MKSVLFALLLAVPAMMGYETTELTDDSWDAEIGAMDTALGKSQLKTSKYPRLKLYNSPASFICIINTHVQKDMLQHYSP